MENPKEVALSPGRVIIAALVLVFFIALTWIAATIGWGSLMTNYAAKTNQLAAGSLAVQRTPRSADAHYVYATILEARDLRRAVAQHREAVIARPQDYALWLSLARAEELNGNATAAITAAQRATTLAPFYSQPHYQLGNLLLRAGRRTEGFAELRLTAASDPALLPGIIDLAWQISKGDPQFVEDAIDARDSESRLVVAQYFRRQKRIDAAILMFASAGPGGKDARENYVGELIGSNHFRDAATLWQVDHPNSGLPDKLDDAGFESEIDLSQRGFNWRAGEKTEAARLVLDAQNPAEGKSSLRIEFNGGTGHSQPTISQFVRIEPNSRYELHFAARTEAIVSGGVPYLAIIDPNSQAGFARSADLAGTTDGWREYTIGFATSSQAEAIQIGLLRSPCSSQPCPIFGRLWLDKFSLQKL